MRVLTYFLAGVCIVLALWAASGAKPGAQTDYFKRVNGVQS